MADTWDTIATTWDTETQKWDVIDYTFIGTLSCRVSLDSEVAHGLVFVGSLEVEVELNSPPDFPQITLDGTFPMYAHIESLIDYSIWVEEAEVSRTWTTESPS